MERWVGKVAVVTGASTGIGACIATTLVKSGMIVIGCARRKEKVQELKSVLIGSSGELHACELDVTNEESIKKTFDWIEKTFGGVNVLVNNAGRTEFLSILGDENSLEAVKKTIDTNLIGLISCTKHAFNILQKTGDYGHIVNISSIVAHKIPEVTGRITKFNVYPASKHALRATTEILKQELKHLNKKIKLSQISPGLVNTEFLHAAGSPNPEETMRVCAHLEPKDIADACLYILSTPPNVLIDDLIISPIQI